MTKIMSSQYGSNLQLCSYSLILHTMLFFLKISFENCFNDDVGNECLMTIDSADFRIWEPRLFDCDCSKIWYSSKFQGAGVRYEVGICIRTGDII